MLKISNVKIFIIFFFVVNLMPVFLFAQEETVEQRREREHQAVSDYIFNSLNNWVALVLVSILPIDLSKVPRILCTICNFFNI